jgi:outer membrane protein assembly factor BamB
MLSRLGWVVALGSLLSATACDCCNGHCHEVIPPACGVQPPSGVDFGNERVGDSKTLGNQSLLTSTGGIQLGITGWKISGANAKDFSITSKLPSSVLAGGNVSGTVRFTPAAAGPRTATLELTTDCDSASTVNVPLSGNGVQIQVCAQPNPVNFNNVQVGGAPVTQQVTLTNCGGSPADLAFASVPIEGPNANDYTLSGQVNETLQPGAMLTLNVAFSPSVVGASTADIPYQICSGCSNQKINLTGVGIDCALGFAPSPITFATTADGVMVTTQVTVTDTGNGGCIIAGLTIQNPNSPFTVASAPPTPISLSAGQNFTLMVGFSPFAGSMNMDTLVATYNVADMTVGPRTATDPIIGNAIQTPCSISVTPATTLFYGSVNANVPVTKSVTVNDVGNLPCMVSNIAIGAGSDPGFVLAPPGTTSFTVNPGTPVSIPVTFSSATVSSPYLRTGTLTFNTSDTTKPSATVHLNAYLNNTAYSSGWPKWHFDNRNSGQSEANTAWLQGSVGWKYPVGSPSGYTYINSPVVDTAGNVYQLGMDGTFYAITPGGTKLWSTSVSAPTSDPHPSTPAILSNGNMYLMTGSDGSPPNLYLISSTGAVLYSVGFGEDGFDACPGIGNDGTLFEADDDGSGGGDPDSAIAFKATGNSVTQVAGISLPLTNESERFGIAIADDNTSYWGNNGQFFAITPPPSPLAPTGTFTQSAAWPHGGVTIASGSLFSDVISDLAVDGRVNNNIYAYAAWEGFDAAGNTTVQGILVALNPANGATVWTVQLPQSTLGSISLVGSEAGNAAPAVGDDGTVYVGNGDGLRAVDGATGSVKWLFKSADVTSSPAIGGDGTVFFGTLDGNLYAVNPDGSLRFKVVTGGTVSASPAIASDGTVYVTSDDGNVYQIK